MFNDSTYPFNFMTTGDGVDSDLVIPDSFGQCLSYEQQIAFILKLIDDIDGGVVIPEITADATVDQSTGTPSVTVVKTGDDEAPVFTFNFHNIKGERGEKGETGETGATGETGRPGNDGADGISPTVTTAQIANGYRITITDADGSHVFDIYNGNDGETGPAGYSPTVTVQTITGGHSVTITDEDGDHTFNVLDGTDGTDGSDGSDGVSPVITSTAITGGHRITIVDAQGTTNVDVMDGATGATGNGIASTVLNQDYTLTITYTDGTTYTTPSIRGAQGAAGQNGTDGTDGADGISPTVTVRSITGGHQIEIVSAGGTEQFDVMDGSDGTDGVSPTVSVTSITGGHQVSITDAQGTDTFDVMDGTSGSQGPTGPAGPGVPTGGTYGQFLVKNGVADYATGWKTVDLTNSTIFKTVAGVTAPTYETDMGGNITGAYVTLNQIDGGYDAYDPKIPLNSTLIFANGLAMRITYIDTNYRPYRIYLGYSAGWFTYLPKGGSAGQILAKSSANDGEVQWVNAPSAPIIGTITGANGAEIDIKTSSAVFDKQYASLIPNAHVGVISPISSSTFKRLVLSCEVITKNGQPLVIIKPSHSFNPDDDSVDSRISYTFYDVTDGDSTFQQYSGYDIGLEFNDSDFTWSNELSSIHAELLDYNMIPAVYIANPKPVMHFGNYSVDQVYMTAIRGVLYYNGTKIRLKAKTPNDLTGTIFKATAGTISMIDSFPG